MQSQCPQCQAIFKVSEKDIGAHHGLVRCGRCQSIFHAVTNEVGGGHVPPDEEPRLPYPDEGQSPGDDTVPGPDTGRDYTGPALGGTVDQSTPSDIDEAGDPEPVSDVEAAPGTFEAPRVQEDEVREEDKENNRKRNEHTVREKAQEEARDLNEDAVQANERNPMIEPVLPEPPVEAGDEPPAADTGFQGEVEEIVIEAPPVLWDAFRDEDETSTDTAAPERRPSGVVDEKTRRRAVRFLPGRRRQAKATRAESPAPAAAGGRRGALKSPYRAHDISMVELPQPRPFKTASLSLLAVFLVLLLVWQGKTFYLDELAQVAVLRPYLERVCHPLGCVLPPRRDFASIDLVGTSININSEVPGALEITASLVNRAHFPQPYPPLRVTLTDREGRVVGRRTYLPSEYRPDGGHDLLPIKAVRDVVINLAQPAENAVGYEVELMGPVSESAE